MPPGSNDSSSQTLTPDPDDDPAGLVHSTSAVQSHTTYQNRSSEDPEFISDSYTCTEVIEGAKSTGVPGLKRLPYEILSYIVQELSLDTIFNLALTCHHFQYLVREGALCKMLLRVSSDSANCLSVTDTTTLVESSIFAGSCGCGG
jgi:hypothetical protein